MGLKLWFVLVTVPFQLFVFIYIHSSLNSSLSFLEIEPDTPSQKAEPSPGGTKAYHLHRYFYVRGAYTVLQNYVRGTESVGYMESVTLATHATPDYMDNVLTLVEFWSGPISLAIYAPGPQFEETLTRIGTYYECSPESIAKRVRERVTFHIFFETKSLDEMKDFRSTGGLYGKMLPKIHNCAQPEFPMKKKSSFLKKHKIMFPINVARNIAKESAETYFVLVSDIELYPNPPDLISQFLSLIKRRRIEGKEKPELQREVFVIPPFEVSKRVDVTEIPRTKAELTKMLAKRRGRPPLAHPFHYFACFLCHRIPNLWKWIDAPPSKNMSIFHSGNYITTAAWEPFYIGTRFDPPFDERLMRENALNKPIQAAILCHSNYIFHILDSAFFVHKPGIKYGRTHKSSFLKSKGLKIVRAEILPFQYQLYGRQKGRCWQASQPIPTQV